jgi:hypothetical protein
MFSIRLRNVLGILLGKKGKMLAAPENSPVTSDALLDAAKNIRTKIIVRLILRKIQRGNRCASMDTGMESVNTFRSPPSMVIA